MRRLTTTALATTLALGSLAAPAAHAQESDTYAVTGATIHTVANGTIENGTIVMRAGQIVAVGGADTPIPAGATIIEGSGKHVYPGMVDAFSRLGLTEIGAVSATNDQSEMGDWNPHLEAYQAIHPASEHIPVARANGITHTLAAPGGGTISGQATLIHLDGWTVEEMRIEESAGMVISWPRVGGGGRGFFGFGGGNQDRSFQQRLEQYEEDIAELDEWFGAAAHYKQAMDAGSDRVTRDLQLEQLARVLDGGLPVIVQANDERQITDAIEFSEKWGLDLVLAGAEESRDMAATLAEKGIPVILGPVQRTPSDRDAPYDEPNTLPGVLHEAGVEIAFATFNSSDSRTLPYEAANAVPFGLPHDAALEAVTLGPARILGVGDRLGSLETGKTGNVIVADGDPLEITTRIEHVFIKGVPVDLDNKHRRLWEKYKNRPAKATTT